MAVMCSGQLKLATLPDCSRNSRSDSFGVNPPVIPVRSYIARRLNFDYKVCYELYN